MTSTQLIVTLQEITKPSCQTLYSHIQAQNRTKERGRHASSHPMLLASRYMYIQASSINRNNPPRQHEPAIEINYALARR